jgi:succinate dehydrogenase hydrophobic anchor subunit
MDTLTKTMTWIMALLFSAMGAYGVWAVIEETNRRHEVEPIGFHGMVFAVALILAILAVTVIVVTGVIDEMRNLEHDEYE